jgi:hypothetical protein
LATEEEEEEEDEDEDEEEEEGWRGTGVGGREGGISDTFFAPADLPPRNHPFVINLHYGCFLFPLFPPPPSRESGIK